MLTPGNKIIIEPGKGALKGKTHVTLEVVHSELRGESVTLIVPNELMPLLGSMINQYNNDPKFLTTYVSDEQRSGRESVSDPASPLEHTKGIL